MYRMVATSRREMAITRRNRTRDDLAYLDANGLHWDLFANTDNWAGPIVGDPTMDGPDALQRHSRYPQAPQPGQSRIYHPHLGSDIAPTPADPTTTPPTPAHPAELRRRDEHGHLHSRRYRASRPSLNKNVGGGRPHLTRFRPPPTGKPFWPSTIGNAAMVGAEIAKYAGHRAVGLRNDRTRIPILRRVRRQAPRSGGYRGGRDEPLHDGHRENAPAPTAGESC